MSDQMGVSESSRVLALYLAGCAYAGAPPTELQIVEITDELRDLLRDPEWQPIVLRVLGLDEQ